MDGMTCYYYFREKKKILSKIIKTTFYQEIIVHAKQNPIQEEKWFAEKKTWTKKMGNCCSRQDSEKAQEKFLKAIIDGNMDKVDQFLTEIVVAKIKNRKSSKKKQEEFHWV